MHRTTIGLLGFGTVGQALVSLIRESQPQIHVAKAVVRDVHRQRSVDVPMTTRPEDVLLNPSIDVVVDVMGGRDPARQWIKEALHANKDVVTANKEVLAYHGEELLAVARESGRHLRYEAAVAGGVPVLDALAHHLSVVPLERIDGVLNGTCNFVLSAMEQGIPYSRALADAKRLGYAEADPAADIEGDDTARKILLLAQLGFHTTVPMASVDTMGITEITDHHLARLKSFHLGLRLVGTAALNNGLLSLRVAPTVYRVPHPFLSLDGPDNVVRVVSSAGTFWFQGPGAGGYATATSIVSDITRIIHRTISVNNPNTERYPIHPAKRGPYVCFTHDTDRSLPLGLPGEIRRLGSYAIVSEGFAAEELDEYGLCQFLWGEEE